MVKKLIFLLSNMLFYVPTCITNYMKFVIKLAQHLIKLQ